MFYLNVNGSLRLQHIWRRTELRSNIYFFSLHTEFCPRNHQNRFWFGYTTVSTFWLSLWHILSSALPPGAHKTRVRMVKVYWRSCRSVRLLSAMMCRGDKSGYFFSFLVWCVSTDRDIKTPDNKQFNAQLVPRLVPDTPCMGHLHFQT